MSNSSFEHLLIFPLTVLAIVTAVADAQTPLDPGPWPTISHDNQRTNRSPFHGPSTPGTPVVLYDAGSNVNLYHTVVTSDGKTLLTSCSQAVVAIDSTGKPLGSPWPYELLPTAYAGSPEAPTGGLTVSSDGHIYVASHECPDIPGGVPTHFYSIQQNGSITLNWPVASQAMYWGPAIASASNNGLLFQMTEFNVINAYRPDGSIVWSQGLPSYGQGPIAIDSADNLYVGTDAPIVGGHAVYSFTASGVPRAGWPQDTGGATAQTAPVIGTSDVVYIATQGGALYAFNPDGSPRAGFPFVGGGTASQLPLALASSGATIYMKTTLGLFAINTDGTKAWSVPFNPGGDATLSPGPVVDASGFIYVAFGNNVYSLNPDGTIRIGWPVTVPGAGYLLIAGEGTLYVVSAGQKLYSITSAPPSLTLGARAAANAKSLLGNPYFLGAKGFDYGSTPNEYISANVISTGYKHCDGSIACSGYSEAPGIDCSGLVMWSYNVAAGASTQYIDTNPIRYEGAGDQCTLQQQSLSINAASLSDLLPGDILCFRYHYATTPPENHVAMYVGQGEVVEAYLPGVGVVSSTLIPDSQGRTRANYDVHSNWSTCTSPQATRCFDFLGYRRPIQSQVGIAFATGSPVTLSVTDPDGYIIDSNASTVTHREVLREVPGQLYYLQDSNSDDTVLAPVLKQGQYLVKVFPKAGANATDTFSLTVQSGSSTIPLATGLPIGQIPPSGYGIDSTGGIARSFSPVTIDIEPKRIEIEGSSSRTISVAILSTSTFNAFTGVDKSSLTFGRTGNEVSLAECDSRPTTRLMCHFYLRRTGFVVGTTQGVLRGKTVDGEPIEGSNAVQIQE